MGARSFLNEVRVIESGNATAAYVWLTGRNEYYGAAGSRPYRVKPEPMRKCLCSVHFERANSLLDGSVVRIVAPTQDGQGLMPIWNGVQEFGMPVVVPFLFDTDYGLGVWIQEGFFAAGDTLSVKCTYDGVPELRGLV